MLPFLGKLVTRSGLVGGEVGAQAIAVAWVERRSSGPQQVKGCAFQAVSEPSDLGAVLTDMVARNQLRGCNCVVVLASGSYQLLQVEPPIVPAAELREAVRWRIKDLVDFSVEEAAVDCFQLPDGVGGSRSTYVAAASALVIQRCVEQVHGSGLKLQAIDIAEFALRNLAALLPENEAGVALLSIGEDSSLVGVFRQSNLYLARSLNGGYRQLADLESPLPASASGEITLAMEPALNATLAGMGLEIQRTLDYYESQLGQPPVSRLVLLPTKTPLPALLEYLQSNTSAKVSAMQCEQLLGWQTQPTEETMARSCNALGGALRQEGAVA